MTTTPRTATNSVKATKPKAELHPELLNSVTDGDIPFVHHPFAVFPYQSRMDDALIAVFNEAYEARRRQAAEAFDSENWGAYVFAHKRPYRLDALFEAAHEGMPDETYWPLVSDVWTDIEGPSTVLHRLPRLFYPAKYDHGKRFLMMDPDEREVFAELPDPVAIHRGCVEEYRRGWSWTLDPKRAIWFIKRWPPCDSTSVLLSASCQKSDVLAYLNGRKEAEIIVDGSKVTIEAETVIK